jgi:hypothetical protein
VTVFARHDVSMRRRVLVNSVRRLLPDDVDLVDVVFMWRRHRWMLGWAISAAAVVFGVALIAGYGSVQARIGVAVAVGLVIAVVTTDYRVLAHTTGAPHLFQASRIRQVATALVGPLEPDATIELVGSNLVLTDWVVDGERFTVPKNSQAAMTRLADET